MQRIAEQRQTGASSSPDNDPGDVQEICQVVSRAQPILVKEFGGAAAGVLAKLDAEMFAFIAYEVSEGTMSEPDDDGYRWIAFSRPMAAKRMSKMLRRPVTEKQVRDGLSRLRDRGALLVERRRFHGRGTNHYRPNPDWLVWFSAMASGAGEGPVKGRGRAAEGPTRSDSSLAPRLPSSQAPCIEHTSSSSSALRGSGGEEEDVCSSCTAKTVTGVESEEPVVVREKNRPEEDGGEVERRVYNSGGRWVESCNGERLRAVRAREECPCWMGDDGCQVKAGDWIVKPDPDGYEWVHAACWQAHERGIRGILAAKPAIAFEGGIDAVPAAIETWTTPEGHRQYRCAQGIFYDIVYAWGGQWHCRKQFVLHAGEEPEVVGAVASSPCSCRKCTETGEKPV